MSSSEQAEQKNSVDFYIEKLGREGTSPARELLTAFQIGLNSDEDVKTFLRAISKKISDDLEGKNPDSAMRERLTKEMEIIYAFSNGYGEAIKKIKKGLEEQPMLFKLEN